MDRLQKGKLFLLTIFLITIAFEILFCYIGYQDTEMLFLTVVLEVILMYLVYLGKSVIKIIFSVFLILNLFSILLTANFLEGGERLHILSKIGAVWYLFSALIIHFSTQISSFLSSQESNRKNLATKYSQENKDLETTHNEPKQQDIKPVYQVPSLVKRYQSAFIDVFFTFFVAICMSFVFDKIGNVPTVLRVSILMGVIFLYEPIFTAYKFTLGQFIMKIRVKSIDNIDKRIALHYAFIRFFVKILLGWYSFIAMHFNDERRAVHDFAAKSIMIEV